MTQSSIERSPVSCAYCTGTGQVNDEACRACGATGSVLAGQPARPCAHCDGKGRKSAYRCNVCRGTGWANVKA